MHWTATLRDHTLPRESRVAVDLKCKACGYNLKFAPVDAKCPECGEAVKDSLRHLSLPGGIIEGIREIAYGSLALLIALLFYIPPISSSIIGILGVLALAISSFFRLLGGSRMRFKKVENQNTLTVLINLMFVLSVIEVLLVAAVFVPVVFEESFSNPPDKVIAMLTTVWVLIATVFLMIVAHTSGLIAILTGYPFVKWECRATILALIIGGAGIGMANSLNLIYQQTWWFPNTADFLFKCIFVLGIMLSFVSSLHAANAAERTINHVEDLIEKTPTSSNQKKATAKIEEP